MGRVTKVVDRTGEIVPFRRSRVVRAILAAVRGAGSSDEWVADKLADMVVYFLDVNHGERPVPPSADDVDDMIEKALLSTPDLAPVSQAFLQARRQHKELREIEEQTAPGTGPEVAQSQQNIEGWNRGRITAALVREQQLDAARAAEVALAVEARVVALNLPRLTTGLIRELVDYELISRGLASQPGALSLPRYDVDQWLFPSDSDDAPAAHQRELARRAASRVLGEYALHGLGENAREMHLKAQVVFEHLDAPAALAALRLDAGACLEPGAGFGMARIYPEAARGQAAFTRLAALVRDAADFTAGPITLRRLDAALAEDGDPDRAALQQGLRLLAWQAPNPLRIELGPSTLGARDLVIRALIDALAGADSALRGRVSLELAVTPGAFAEPARRALIERAAAAACACGEPSFRLREPGGPGGGGLFGDLGGSRHECVLARASLNLVSPALNAPDLATYLAAMDPLIDAAVEGLAGRVRFIERVALRGLTDPVSPSARMMRAAAAASRDVELAPLGLATAAAMLARHDGAGAAGTARAMQQILSYLAFRFSDAARRANLSGTLGVFEGAARERMARRDMSRVVAADPESPRRLVLATDHAYQPGSALAPGPANERMELESAMHAALGRDAALTVGPDEQLPAAELVRLLRGALAEGAPRPTRVQLSVRHHLCRDCGASCVATIEACPACGSTAWAVPPGQKSLFG